jgi:hypothetical protein
MGGLSPIQFLQTQIGHMKLVANFLSPRVNNNNDDIHIILCLHEHYEIPLSFSNMNLI